MNTANSWSRVDCTTLVGPSMSTTYAPPTGSELTQVEALLCDHAVVERRQVQRVPVYIQHKTYNIPSDRAAWILAGDTLPDITHTAYCARAIGT